MVVPDQRRTGVVDPRRYEPAGPADVCGLGAALRGRRSSRRDRRKLRHAQACLEDSSTRRAANSIDGIRQLATGRWIAEHRNVLITGATGVGKTYLACALGQHACRQGSRAIYRRFPRFFQELALARADGSYTTVLARLARVDVLILDDWGLAAVTDVQRQDLLEVMEDRDATRSTIITSQLRVISGTRIWATRRSPTPSSIAWSITRIRSR